MQPTNCTASVNACVQTSSSEDAKRAIVLRMWDSGNHDVATIAAKTYQGTVPQPHAADRDEWTGDATTARKQRARFASWVRRCERWIQDAER